MTTIASRCKSLPKLKTALGLIGNGIAKYLIYLKIGHAFLYYSQSVRLKGIYLLHFNKKINQEWANT